ncbi:PAF1 factor, partial [Oriolus oriolus]|nr:PAF1 factor [Oriolus oriolus]
SPQTPSGSPRRGQLARDLVGALEQRVVDVLGARDLRLDQGQVLGVGQGLTPRTPLALGGRRHQRRGVLGAVEALREALVGQALRGTLGSLGGGLRGFVQYKATSLEKQHKHDLLTEPDLGVTIDLINPDTYRIDPGVLLDPADEKLLEEEIQAPTSSKRSQQHAKVVPWMRKTEYISTEFNRYGVSNEKPEVKILGVSGSVFVGPVLGSSGGSWGGSLSSLYPPQITQHYSKPRVTPLEVMPVFPDFKMWINPCAQVIFDSDPAPKDTSGAAALEMMSQAMIRGMMDEEGNQFVAYFLPVEETLRKRKRDQEDDVDYAPEDVY